MKNRKLLYSLFLTIFIFNNFNICNCQPDTIYNKQGNIIEIGNNYEGKKNGQWTTFYTNGKVESIQNFRYGYKHGNWIWYHENGLICSKEKYRYDNFIKGKFWDDEGNKSDISEVQSEAKYPGGLDAFLKLIRENLKYPENLAKEGDQGRTILQFFVNEDGEIEDLIVVKSSNPEFDQEAMRVVLLSEKWEPALFHGEPIKILFTFPVRFALE